MKLTHFLFAGAIVASGCNSDDDKSDATVTDTGNADSGAVDSGVLPDAGVVTPLEIEGRYTDGFGGHHVFTSTSWWNDGSSYAITQYSNADDSFVAQNAADHPFNPNKWSRVDWTTAASVLYYCQSAYDAADEAAALATARPPATDPATSGCGGAFPWSALTPD
ncbi:MAG: hypothetical protein HY791_16415 [Deltaproteobacteria bacterium]|nr:hypothetical protein [Deltaproteobacteria bacterium]